MAGKYTPLENYLRALPANRKDVRLSFAQIEEILKFKLPSSAYEDQRWWQHETKGNHINKRAWANAGRKVERVEVEERRVKLVRIRD